MTFTLSTKERLLLEDQKSHEQICIEKYNNYANLACDAQLKTIFQTNAQQEQTHLDTINQLLMGQIPNMNQQGGSQAQQQPKQQQQPAPPASPTMPGNQGTTSPVSDKDLCTDLLMTEKYVSGAYNTAIFECKDTQVRDILNHIQKEEQKHGESIFKYMESKGLYTPQ